MSVPFRWEIDGVRGAALTLTVAFLRDIGLPTVSRSDATGFVAGVEIVAGTLHYDPVRVRTSDLLHEAGHLAVLPAEWRERANGDLDALVGPMCEEAFARFPIDSPELRAVLQSGDCEATAWAYAAGVAIGLKSDNIIHPRDYQGAGKAVRLQLSCGAHLGVNGLRHGGMIASVRSYPTMLRWLQR